MMTRQNGFTLIELVVIIALLGVVSAFAIPRFTALEREARAAATQGLAGTVRSAAAMAHSLYLATGRDPVVMEGSSVDITAGYPDARAMPALADSTGFSVTTDGAGSTTTFAKDGSSGPCVVIYTEAAAPSPPSVTVDTSGC